MTSTKNKGFSVVIIILIIAVIAVAGFVVWRMYDSGMSNTNTQVQQTDPNAGYVVIKEWGVRFKPADGLNGVEYFKPIGIESDSFTFTTNELAAISPNCSPTRNGITLGLLTRTKQPDPQYGGVVATLGDYYYQYHGPQAACSNDFQAESKTVVTLSQSLKSLEAVK